MQNFMKTIMSALKTWTSKEIKKSTADWNENDSNSNSYIKNKPFYEDRKLTEVFPEMTVSIESEGGYETLSENFNMLEKGQTYLVILNGVKYECVSRYVEDWGGVILGNGVYFEVDDISKNEPFYIDSYEDGEIYLNTIEPGDYTISILRYETTIHKIDEKYLPTPTHYDTRKLVTTPETTVDGITGFDGYLKVADSIDFDINSIQSMTRIGSDGRELINVPVSIVDDGCPNIVTYLDDYYDYYWGMYFATQEFADTYWYDYHGYSEDNPFTAGLYMWFAGGEDTEASVTYSFTYVDGELKHLDSKYIKDMYYDNGTVVTELVPLQTINNFVLMENSIYGSENPFSINLEEGATYVVNWDGDRYELVCDRADGINYIGNVNYVFVNTGGDIPFAVLSVDGYTYVVTESTKASHEIIITEYRHDLKQVDIKYLPIVEEVSETVFESDEVFGGGYSFEDPEYKKLVGKYEVIIDGNSKIVEFIDSGDYSSVDCDSFTIETWDGEIWLGVWYSANEEAHSVKIIGAANKIAEKYLPDNIGGGQADWNQNDENGPGYIKNRTHYYNRELVWENTFETAEENQSSWDTGLPYSLNPLTSYCIVYNNDEYILETEEWGRFNYPIDSSSYPFFISFTDDGPYIKLKNPGTHHFEMYIENVVKLDEKFIPDSIARADDIVQADWDETDETQNSFIKNKPYITDTGIGLTDISTGLKYLIQIKDGNLITRLDIETILIDFDYTDNGDGTYTLTGWKGTYNGKPSTEMIIPNFDRIIL